MWNFPDVIKFNVAVHRPTLWEKAIRFQLPAWDCDPDRAQKFVQIHARIFE